MPVHCPEMDAEVKKTCPSCSQPYSMKSHNQKSRVPLLQKCGHSSCEDCLRNILKFSEPIVCKICQRETEITPNMSPKELYAAFPPNIYMLGELAFQTMLSHERDYSDRNYYINLKELIKTVGGSQGVCVECKAPTTKQCRECQTVLCQGCFLKIHKFHVFKNHVFTDIESIMEPNYCGVHLEKQLDYYCKDCSKTICMDCMIVGGERSCKNHDVIPVREMNETVVEELNDMTPKIDETYRRLTKTAVDVGNLLKNLESGVGDSELDKMMTEVYNHFSKLLATIQKHLQETMGTMNKLKNIEKKSLVDAKKSLEESIKKALVVLKKTNAVMVSDCRNKANLSAILDDAKQVMNAPWYLVKEEKKQDPLKIAVNEDLYVLVSDFVHLEGNADPAYLLKATDQINEELPPAPSHPVFAPELVKDVRESFGFTKKHEAAKSRVELNHNLNMEPSMFVTNAPKYRSKSGSNSSLNSIGSDNSHGRSVFSSHSRGDSYTPVVSVMPYAESNHPKPLVEGSQEIIYISHIISPDHFYVQRACHQNYVKEMSREFRSAGSLPKPTLNHLAEGKIYLAFTPTDNEWQRARVVSIERDGSNKPLCHVFCIDFGNTEVVAFDKLRLLPSARLHSPPPLAISCSLANCAPRYGAWSDEDALLIQKITDNKKALLNVRRILSTSDGTVKVQGDLTAVEHRVSLLHALVFHERAKMIDYKLPYPQLVNGDVPKLIFSSDFKMKTNEAVVITHIVSPDKFYVRRCHFEETYNKLCDELNDFYSPGVTTGSVHCPEVGMFCVVYHTVEGGRGNWQRALVTEVPGRLRVRVLLPDTGETALVHHTALRTIKTDFAKIKALAVECHLSGITPYNQRWSTSSVALLRQFAGRRLCLAPQEARGRRHCSLGVVLYDGDECINMLMVRHKFAMTIGMYSFTKHNKPLEDQAYMHKTPLEKQMAQPKPKPKPVTILKKNQEPPKATDADSEDLEAKDKGPLKIEVKVLSCISPSLLYVTLCAYQKSFMELYNKLQEHYSEPTNPKADWTVGEKCCALYKETKTWRRAVVLELKGENATVFFSDFAIVETLPITELRELDQEFAKVGDAAIKCHLTGIVPALGGEWPSLTKEFLRELLDAYQRIFITRNGSIKDKSLPVEVWVYHVIQGDALEPDRAEWRCLNKKIIEQGLAIPDKDQELTTETDKKELDEDMISIFNITGSIREWLQLDTKPNSEGTLTPDESVKSEEVEEKEDVENTKFVSDWLPPEPLTAKEFIGIPTYVDGDGHIYLHDVNQQSTLDLIRNALDVRFKNSRPSRNCKWYPGSLCIAKFYLDDRFYRGRVLEADSEGAVVHYIDYGNEERCANDHLRRCVVLHEIPTQAHKCRLANIRSVGGAWDRTTLDYIHKSVVEKQCFVRIVGEPAAGAIPIELKFDKLWLNDHLVEFELAAYTDGKKAKVSKYVPLPAPAALDDSQDTGSSSGPDYLVDEATAVDWNTLVEEEENLLRFPDTCVPRDFAAHVICFNEHPFTLELSLVHNDETNLIYEEMFAELQAQGDACPQLADIRVQQACLAKFHEDGRWYRATIQQHDEVRGLVHVRYVDYGNYEVVPVTEVREIREQWAGLPPRAVHAALNNLQLAPDITTEQLTDFQDTFLNKGPFHVSVIETEPVLSVELTNDDGSRPHEHLIKSGVLINSQQCH